MYAKTMPESTNGQFASYNFDISNNKLFNSKALNALAAKSILFLENG